MISEFIISSSTVHRELLCAFALYLANPESNDLFFNGECFPNAYQARFHPGT